MQVEPGALVGVADDQQPGTGAVPGHAAQVVQIADADAGKHRGTILGGLGHGA